MRILSFILLLILMVNHAYSLTTDTVLIRLTNLYNTDEGKPSKRKVTIQQQFMTPDERIFREVNLNEETTQIDNYIFFFYKDSLLISKEKYNAGDTLINATRYEYDNKGETVNIIIYKLKNDFLEVSEKTSIAYNDAGDLLTEKCYKDGKLSSIIRFSYDNQGHRIREVHKSRKPYAEGIKSEVKEFRYNDKGKKESMTCSQINAQNELYTYKETYSYDTTGLFITVETTDKENRLLKIHTYKYLPGNYISVEEETNQNGKITRSLRYDYKKHFMETGTQTSIFEKYPIK